jgi:hypothetical protein
MSDDGIRFLPYEEAAQLVGAIQEEEDIDQQDHRIFTVYSKDDKELCWFDYEDVLNDVKPGRGEDAKEKVTDYILHRIPDWVLEL